MGVGPIELPPGLVPQATTAVSSVEFPVDVLWNHECVLVGVNARRAEPRPELLRLGEQVMLDHLARVPGGRRGGIRSGIGNGTSSEAGRSLVGPSASSCGRDLGHGGEGGRRLLAPAPHPVPGRFEPRPPGRRPHSQRRRTPRPRLRTRAQGTERCPGSHLHVASQSSVAGDGVLHPASSSAAGSSQRRNGGQRGFVMVLGILERILTTQKRPSPAASSPGR